MVVWVIFGIRRRKKIVLEILTKFLSEISSVCALLLHQQNPKRVGHGAHRDQGTDLRRGLQFRKLKSYLIMNLKMYALIVILNFFLKEGPPK